MTGMPRPSCLRLEDPAAAVESVGAVLGPTAWVNVDQKRIDTFAKATEDHQWIHVDPVMAASKGQRTIAHGFLTLSLLSHWLYELAVTPRKVTVINYGLNRVRFLAPVFEGSRLRMSATVIKAESRAAQVTLEYRCEVECEGSNRPACVAEFLVRYVW